jgi:hypothetical protein
MQNAVANSTDLVTEIGKVNIKLFSCATLLFFVLQRHSKKLYQNTAGRVILASPRLSAADGGEELKTVETEVLTTCLTGK